MRVSYASQCSCLETAKRRSDAARPQWHLTWVNAGRTLGTMMILLA